MSKTKHTGVNALARELGLNPSTVSKKLTEGKSVSEIRQEASERKRKEATRAGRESKAEATARKESALADLNELKLAKERGELVPLTEVNAWVAGMILRARDILVRISPELRDRLAQETNPIKVQDLIDLEIHRALVSLSEFRKDNG